MTIRVDKEFMLRRMQNHYKQFFPLLKMPEEVFMETLKSLVVVDTQKSILIISKRDVRNLSFLFLFSVWGVRRTDDQSRFADYEYMNISRAINIYLDKDVEYKTLNDVSAEFLCLSAGFSEFDNKRYQDVMMALANQQFMTGRKIWIFYKGTVSDFKLKFPEAVALFEENGVQIVDLNGSKEVEQEDF